MIKIPSQLQKECFRFIKIKSGTKTPVESEWQLGNNYKWNEKKFQDYLKIAKAYGIVCGYGHLAVIDCDREELAKEILFKLPRSYTIKTGSSKWHVYFTIPDLKEKIVINGEKNKEIIHYGEVQFIDSQVLGCGSLHPNGNYYEILYNEPIKEIKRKELMEVLDPFLIKEKEKCNSGFNWDISKVTEKISGLNKNRDGSLQGSHPVHGSSKGEQGSNFRIDFDKGDGGLWTCYRCGTGGDAVTLIGILEGIMDCSECKKGLFEDHPEKFQQILKIAGKYGYEIDNSKIKDAVVVELFLDKKKTLNVKGIIELIKQECTFITVKDETGRKPQLYYYKDGYYHKDGWLIVEKKAKEILKKYWSIKYRNEIMDYLKTENIINRSDIKVNNNLINLNNGVYDIKLDKLLQHDSKYLFLYKIPWNYNQKAKCPEVMKFLKSTLDDEFIKVSLEIFGYCLYPEYIIPSVFYLYGTGGNGKSVWSTILTSLLGTKNVTAIEVHDIFENRFSAAALYGKLANICGEIDQKTFQKTSIIKDITGGNYIQAELKGRDSFSFKNTAKIISACNTMPFCNDYSEGWRERQYVIPFLKHFRGEKEEKLSLGEKLSKDQNEMEGLLKLSIDALKIIIKNRKFSYEGYKNVYENASYSIINFIEENIERTNDSTDYLTNEEIYIKFNKYCKKKKIPTPSFNELSRKLTYCGFKVDIIKISGKTTRIRKFCEWKNEEVTHFFPPVVIEGKTCSKEKTPKSL